MLRLADDHLPVSLQAADSAVTPANLPAKPFQRIQQRIRIHADRAKALGHIVGSVDGILDGRADPGQFGCVSGISSPAPIFKRRAPQQRGGQVLAQTIVQFSAEPPPLFLAETANGIFEFPAALSLLLKLVPRTPKAQPRQKREPR